MGPGAQLGLGTNHENRENMVTVEEWRYTVVGSHLRRALRMTRNSNGRNTVPWGTPKKTSLSDEIWDFSINNYHHLSGTPRSLPSTETVGLWHHRTLNLCSWQSCGMVSEALLKSRIAMSTFNPLLKLLAYTSWVSQEYPALNPWFTFVRTWCLSKWSSIARHMICYSIFYNTEVSETGWVILSLVSVAFFINDEEQMCYVTHR